MRRVAIRFKRRPIWKCYATGVRLFGVRRSPVANKPAMDQSQGALVDVGRNCQCFLSQQSDIDRNEGDYAANLPKSHHAKDTVYTSF